MLKTSVSRLAAGAVISAVLAAGSLTLTATTAAATCTTPDCIRGVPPVPARAVTRAAINCPPSVAVAMTSSGDGPGC